MRESISQHLGISSKWTSEVLDFLTSAGLAVKTAASYKIGTSRIHLGNESPLISKMHTN